MFKKFICITLSLALVCGSLSGCGKKAEEADTGKEEVDVSGVQAPVNEAFDTSIYEKSFDWEHAKIELPVQLDTVNKNGLMSIYLDTEALLLDIDSRMESAPVDVILYTDGSDKLYSKTKDYSTGEEQAIVITGEASEEAVDEDSLNLLKNPFVFIKYITNDFQNGTIYDICEVASTFGADNSSIGLGDNGSSGKNMRFYAYINRDTQKIERVDNIIDDRQDPNLLGITCKHIESVPVPNWIGLCKEGSDEDAFGAMMSMLLMIYMIDDGSLSDQLMEDFSISSDSEGSSEDAEDEQFVNLVIEYPDSDAHPGGLQSAFDMTTYCEEHPDLEMTMGFEGMSVPVDPSKMFDEGDEDALTGKEKITASLFPDNEISAEWDWKKKEWVFTYANPAEQKYHDSKYWEDKCKGYTGLAFDHMTNEVTVTDAEGEKHLFTWDEEKEDFTEVSE